MALYIPHGSDNTQLYFHRQIPHLFFISHMVQIIPFSFLHLLLIIYFFISHMVQIIRSGCRYIYYRISRLYIPHGSDNTGRGMTFPVRIIWLYIPHGSDNTITFISTPPIYFGLYIPHGSDNTTLGYSISWPHYYLYIPHGSDNTGLSIAKAPTLILTLYPTWFR